MDKTIIVVIAIIIIAIIAYFYYNSSSKTASDTANTNNSSDSSTKEKPAPLKFSPTTKPYPLTPAGIEQEDPNIDFDAVYRYRYVQDGNVSDYSDEVYVDSTFKYFPSFIIPPIPDNTSVEIERKTLSAGQKEVLQDWTRLMNGLVPKKTLDSLNRCFMDIKDTPLGGGIFSPC